MIHIQGKLPRQLYLACSGGIDSMAALDFLRRNHEVTVLYFNHNTAHGNDAEDFVRDYCNERDIEHYIGYMPLAAHKPDRMSQEEFWRTQRYAWLDQGIGPPIVTCHHLDDCVETWIWSSLNGTGKVIPYRRGNVIRPFRTTRKRDFELWAALNNVPHIEDHSNANTDYTRNYIRHTMMPHVLKVNPGIHKVVKKKVLEDNCE